MSAMRLEATSAGIALIIKALNNETAIEFTDMVFGNGEAGEDPSALGNALLTISATKVTKGDNYVEVSGTFDNTDVANDFALTEIGVYATDPDKGDILFAYVHQAPEDADAIKATSSAKLQENEFAVQIIIDNVDNVTAKVSSRVSASKEDLDNHINDKNNPHQVTAEQVGLGNVENCKHEDAEIHFEEATESANLVSGSKLKILMGQIARVVRMFYEHLTARNPHKIKPADIGAAAGTHSHSADDINSGALRVARGGTGNGAWTANGLLYASKKEEFAQIKPPSEASVLMQDATGAPYMLPISQFKIYERGATPPSNTNLLWIDTAAVTGGLKAYDQTSRSWKHVPVAYTS